MNNEPVRMTIAAAYTLYNTINSLLYDEVGTERNIPFNIKYKLLRSKDILEKDVIFFENERNSLIKQLGDTQEDGSIKVKEENSEEFTKEISDLLKIEVEHTLLKVKPEDMDHFDMPNIQTQALDLFMAAMIDDPDFKKDIETPINKTKSEEIAE